MKSHRFRRDRAHALPPFRPSVRRAVPNLSPTRPPAPGTHDASLWPSWCQLPVEFLDLDLFDDEGSPVRQEGGC